MNKILKGSIVWAFGAISILLTFVPETVFGSLQWQFVNYIVSAIKPYCSIQAVELNTIFNKLLSFLVVWLVSAFVFWLISKCRKLVTIKDKDFIIKVEYGDLFRVTNCKRVINFDECYTTTVGTATGDIKPTSVCGQYLKANPGLNMIQLISDAYLKPERSKSAYQKKERYKSGTIVPNGDDLLLAFAMLDDVGRGMFPSSKEYVDSLLKMWDEIDKYYCQKDVCIPILGSRITRIGNGSGRCYSQQELLDMIIWSYRMSPRKIKKPHALRIICKKEDDFSLDKISTV